MIFARKIGELATVKVSLSGKKAACPQKKPVMPGMTGFCAATLERNGIRRGRCYGSHLATTASFSFI